MNKILVTGGAGYIGSQTCKLLKLAGYEPVTYDNLSNGNQSFVKWGDLIVGELHDTSRLIGALKKHKPIAIIHFAASAYVGESIADPMKYYKNNVGGSLSLLEAMHRVGINKLVYSSTCATYGIPLQLPISESSLQSPISPYGQSKLMVEKIIQDLSTKGAVKAISMRYFNAAGADSACEIGELHNPETHLIPLAINSAFGGGQLEVFGSDFPTPDGTAIRDYIHVEDLARAHILAVEYLLNGGSSDVFNLGAGQGVSVGQIISRLRAIGVPVVTKMGVRREGDPAHLVADPSYAIKKLGWQPIASSIDNILTTALAWHKFQLTLK
ncbi:UDP-glucose 4-epimerase GalE [Polynucleobacter sp. 73C-SIWE]|uniref:UDP-glucose 4-epimerase GalE n=1 Tax=Polynucleobacter sp. 73C-SIWE TaxID=2689098 RepID=UPI001C0DC879|nr:UDP-glucose 4-epimerase GalE [Polynucleobacter sp. 73C-SIWE]MBU3578638.1 UDP-glucose 4-epimerase GalE [Polynucleobacter sp. 73C-SIWE]